MKDFILYLINSAITLGLIYACYFLLVRQLTFYRLNRCILLGGMFIATFLPLLKLPVLTERLSLDTVFLDTIFVSPENVVAQTGASAGWNVWQILFYGYLLVTAAFLFRFVWQLLSLALLAQRSKLQKQGELRFYQHPSVSMPFTFFKNIFLNPENVSRQIVDHELTHAQQLHSIDNILAELYAILFWFNPLSWRYKKELTLNLEYLADKGALQYGHAQQNYQLQLLKASICEPNYALVNHFAQTIIKKRIKMMNTNPSPRNKQWRYLLFIPALAMAFFISNCQKHEEKIMPIEVEKPQKSEIQSEIANITIGDGSAVAVETTIETAIEKNMVFNFASIDKKPRFPGGNDKIMGYIGENFNYPAEAKAQNVQGMVLVQFTIEKDGSITNVNAVRGKDLGAGLAEEAVRVVKNMPRWSPGINNGENVRVSYTIPVVCRLQ